MNKRTIKVLKSAFAIFAILIILSAAICTIIFFNFKNTKQVIKHDSFKDISAIIDYIEDYNLQNKSYPKTIPDKLKNQKEITYKYNADDECYTLEIRYKKKNLTKTHKHCSSKNENINKTSTFKSYNYIK